MCCLLILNFSITYNLLEVYELDYSVHIQGQVMQKKANHCRHDGDKFSSKC